MDREVYLNKLTEKHQRAAAEYLKLSKEYGEKKAVIRTMIAANIKHLMTVKKNVGIEMAEIILISEYPQFAGDYARMLELESLLRGYDEVLNQLKSEQIKEQSVMKHYGEHDGYHVERSKTR